MKRESLSVSMPSVWAYISTTGFLKGDETCSGDPNTYGHSADYLPGRYSYTVNSGCQAHMVIKRISTVKDIRKTCFLTLAVKRILV